MAAFKTPVRTFQLWSNAFVHAKKLPLALVAVDDALGDETLARVRLTKLCLGYTKRYANDRITDTLLRQLQHPLWRTLFSPAQWTRGLAYRASLRRRPTSAIALARAVLNHRNAVFAYSSPTGGTARAGLVAAAEGRKSHVAATGGYVWIDQAVLRFLLECCNRGRTLINCVVNGSHRSGSKHYSGDAADIDKGSRTDVYAAARASGTHILDEDRFHWHEYVGATP